MYSIYALNGINSHEQVDIINDKITAFMIVDIKTLQKVVNEG